jgi:hypothetical protein
MVLEGTCPSSDGESAPETVEALFLLGLSSGAFCWLLASREPLDDLFFFGPPDGGGENEGKDVRPFGDAGTSLGTLPVRPLPEVAEAVRLAGRAASRSSIWRYGKGEAQKQSSPLFCVTCDLYFSSGIPRGW